MRSHLPTLRLLAACCLAAACGGTADITSTNDQQDLGSAIDGKLEYRLINQASGRCLGVAGASHDNLAAIVESACTDSTAQQFRFQALGDGSFVLRSRNSGKCLDVSGGSTAAGAALIQYSCHGHPNQRFAPAKQSDGSFKLTAAHSHQVIDVAAAQSGAASASVVQSPLGAAVSQGWKLSAIASSSTAGKAIPIKHVVVLVKENHTFDNYFGTFPGANGTLDANGNAVCATAGGGNGPCQEAPDATSHDLCHEHSCALADWNGGKMNGWNNAGGSDTGDGLAYKQYFEKDLPNYWAYASRFTLADNFYANVLGPSFPGHMFTVAAQAGWATGNPPTDLPFKVQWWPFHVYGPNPFWGCDEWPGDTVPILAGGKTPANVFPCFNVPSIPDVLPAGVDWKFYGTNFDGLFSEQWTLFDAIGPIRNNPAKWSHVVNADQFSRDVQNGTLPAVSWLVDQDQNSEHPATNVPGINIPIGGICSGENWTVGYLNQLASSQYWQDTVVLITMDDFGGWHDHVNPPRQYGGSAAAPYGLGFRLPLIIVSPYARPGFVFHEQAEQASIARFIERVFGSTTTLSQLDPAAQDGQANDLFDAFDFGQTPNPPPVLPLRSCPLIP
jgi:phospholipase C